MDVPILQKRSPVESTLEQNVGPQIRLLACYICKSIDELPDWEGHPDDDTLLQISVEKHTDALGLPHVGRLMKVPLKHWSNTETRNRIVAQISNKGAPGLSAVDAEIYDSRSTFYEDAMTCFRKHQRPKGRCPDWKADSKRLQPNTAAERKEAGLPKLSKHGPSVYMCDFCVVKTFMMTQEKKAAGLYD